MILALGLNMTGEEVAALRRRAREWQQGVATEPEELLALYERIVDACLRETPPADDLPAPEIVER